MPAADAEAPRSLTLVIDADATTAIGAGHLMRCATLAEAWLDEGLGAVTFAGRLELGFAQARARGLEAWREASRVDPEVLVVDSYDPVRRQRALRHPSAVLRVLVDDASGPVADGYDAVWNPNAYASIGRYHAFGGLALAGPSALPIRLDLPVWEAPGHGTAVTLGGGAPPPSLREAVALLAATGSASDWSGLGDWLPESCVRLEPRRPWHGLVQASRLLTAAGSTVWEAAAVGVPVAVVLLADNQREVFQWVRSQGVPAVNPEEHATPASLAAALAAALTLARPLPPLRSGADHVARCLAALATPTGSVGPLRFRLPTVGDAERLWVWANDVATRDASYGRGPISWGAHQEWFDARLSDPATWLRLALDSAGRPVGVIRCETGDDWSTARLSFALAPRARGRGLGAGLVADGVEEFRREHPATTLAADVVANNSASLRIFRRLSWPETPAADRHHFRSAGVPA